MADARKRRTVLDQVLNVFAEVRAGEGLLAVIMTLNIFLILNSYYVLKPIRDSLITNTELFGIRGDELKSYLAAAMAFLIIFAVRGYGSLASRVNRVTLLNITSAFIVVCVLIFFALLRLAHVTGPAIAIVYFLWLGIVNVFIIAQFWSYANDVYTEKQGKRLFAIIAIGQSTGAIMGAWLTQNYGKKYTFVLLFAAAVVLAIVQVLYNVINRRVKHSGTGGDQEETAAQVDAEDEAPLSKDGGFGLVLRSKYLFFIALMILLANLVNTTGEFLIGNYYRSERARLYPDNMYTGEWVAGVQAGEIDLPNGFKPEDVKVIEDEGERKATVDKAQKGYGTSFFGSFYFWVNLCGALIQMFIVSRLFKFIGVRGALFVLPVIAFAGNFFFGLIGSLMALRISKTAENSTDYSLQNTVKQALFLPTSREEKYKAKAAIDMFFVRLGDALSAGVIAFGIHVLAFGRQQFAFVNVALGVIWLLVCVRIFREHRKLVPPEG